LAEAGAEFREALRLNPNYPEASNNLANVLRAKAGQRRRSRFFNGRSPASRYLPKPTTIWAWR